MSFKEDYDRGRDRLDSAIDEVESAASQVRDALDYLPDSDDIEEVDAEQLINDMVFSINDKIKYSENELRELEKHQSGGGAMSDHQNAICQILQKVRIAALIEARYIVKNQEQ